MEHDHWACGLHSGIPQCCVRWAFPPPFRDAHTHHTIIRGGPGWVGWLPPMLARWRGADGMRGIRGPRNFANLSIYGQFIPCPNHQRIAPQVRLLTCPDMVWLNRFSDLQTACA